MNAPQEKDWWEEQKHVKGHANPLPFLGSVRVLVMLAVSKQLLLHSQPATLGRRTRGLERLSQMSCLSRNKLLVAILFIMRHHVLLSKISISLSK